MSNEFDIPLNETQLDSLRKAGQSIRDKFMMMNPPTHESILANYWHIYFEYFIYQSVVASSGKKKSTRTRDRRSVLKKMRDMLGFFPKEKEVKTALSYGEVNDDSLIKLVLKDIQQLSNS